jgi:hypothetical protein
MKYFEILIGHNTLSLRRASSSPYLASSLGLYTNMRGFWAHYASVYKLGIIMYIRHEDGLHILRLRSMSRKPCKISLKNPAITMKSITYSTQELRDLPQE